jgi:hypothetical protein
MFDERDIDREATFAVRNHIKRHTAGIWQQMPYSPAVGSAVLIEIADRLFLATAAHNFSDIPRGGKYTIFPATGSSDTPLVEIRHNLVEYGREGTLDLAWLEIEPESAARSHIAGLPLSSLEPYHQLDSVRFWYNVIGFPWEGRSVQRSAVEDRYLIPLMVYTTSAAQASQPDSDELLLDYPEKGPNTQHEGHLPHPGGLSGGPIWAVPILTPNDNQLWSLDKFHLAGIVTHYLPTSQRLLGIPMHHWLKLVVTDNPELSQHIEPVLKQDVAR